MKMYVKCKTQDATLRVA